MLALLGVAPPPLGSATATVSLPEPGAPVTMQAGDRWFPRDELGRAFVMHGYNIKLHGDRLHEVTPSVLRQMRDNGFTVLRLATFWADLEPTEGDWDEDYIADLRRILRDAASVDLQVVLTMHQDSYSPEVGGYGMPDWTTRTDGLVYSPNAIPCLEPANQRAWEHFYEDEDIQEAHVRAWTKMVEELQHEDALYGYDVLNEPCGEMRPGESIQQALHRVEAEQITPMLQRVTDAIRTLDTRAWIFLEGAYALTSSLGAPPGLGAVHDATGRQIFAPHIYDLAMEAGLDWNPSSPFVSDYYAMIGDYGATHEIPTIVFEWGPQFPTFPNAEDYVHQVMHGADAAVAGWSAFAWVRGLWSWSQLDSDGNPGGGMTDNVQTYPVHVAGRPMDIDSDYPGGRSTVTVDPAGTGASGPTTFYFPLRRFPTGPEVSVDLPDELWSWSFDEDTQTVSVDVGGTDRHTITVAPAAFAFEKVGSAPTDADGDGHVEEGDTIEFTFTVENLVDRPLGAPTVTDPLIDDVACPDTEVAVGAVVTCTGTYALTEVDIAVGSVTNQAVAVVADGSTERRSRAETTVTWDKTVIELEKRAELDDADGDELADVGETIRYSFEVANIGTTGVADLVVDDPMLGTVSCEETELAPGARTACTAPAHVVDADDVAAGEIVNEATASAAFDGTEAQSTGRATVPTDPTAVPPTSSTTDPTSTTRGTSGTVGPSGPPHGSTGGRGAASSGRFGPLARTGAPVVAVAVLGGALLAAGLAIATRRRQAVHGARDCS